MRAKLVHVPDTEMLHLMCGDAFRTDTFLMRVPDLPEGFVVHTCFASPECRAVTFMVTHDSFRDVPEGVRPPEMLGMTRVIEIREIVRRWLAAHGVDIETLPLTKAVGGEVVES